MCQHNRLDIGRKVNFHANNYEPQVVCAYCGGVLASLPARRDHEGITKEELDGIKRRFGEKDWQ